MELAAAFRHQSRSCADLGSPMYAGLLARCAQELERGAWLREVLAGHEDDPGPSALALRLLGSVHRLVLERRAGPLAAYYPSVGGRWEPDAGWLAFTELLRAQPEQVGAWLDRPPQTNEVGRSAALYGGLLHLRRAGEDLPVRLFELGASGGLNLRADRFAFVDQDGRRFGAEHAGLVVEGAWRGRRLEPWSDLSVVERLGCDLRPVDVATTEGRLTLTAYTWPDQRTRLERLRAAFGVAADAPAQVRRQGAADFVDDLVLVEGTTTVLWHSAMWQYLPEGERSRVLARLDVLGGQADPGRPLAHLRAEPARRSPGAPHEFLVVLTTWPGRAERVLGSTDGHGVPTTWE